VVVLQEIDKYLALHNIYNAWLDRQSNFNDGASYWLNWKSNFKDNAIAI